MKLKINTWAGIFNIVASVFYLVGTFMGISVAVSEAAAGSSSAFGTFALCFALAGLILHIVALVKSKKANISLTENI